MQTVSEIIDDVFGGTTKAAGLFDVLPSAVSNWKAANRFPDRLHLRVFREAQARGVTLPDSLFDNAAA